MKVGAPFEHTLPFPTAVRLLGYFFNSLKKFWAVLVEESEQSKFFNWSKVSKHAASKTTQLYGNNRFTNLITCEGKLFIYSCLKSNLSWYIIWHLIKSFSPLCESTVPSIVICFFLVTAMYIIHVIFIIYCILFSYTWYIQVFLCVYASYALYFYIHIHVYIKVSIQREKICVCVCVYRSNEPQINVSWCGCCSFWCKRWSHYTFAKMLWNNFFVGSMKCFPVLNLLVSVFLQTKQAEQHCK